MKTTWDGQPISPEPPHGASIIVYRRTGGICEFLILHRAHRGPDYEGEWAWSPPSGARFPGEPVEDCASRELAEETGLSLPLHLTKLGNGTWAIFFAEARPDDQVELDEEHDRYQWLSLAEAVQRCTPPKVSDTIAGVARQLGLD